MLYTLKNIVCNLKYCVKVENIDRLESVISTFESSDSESAKIRAISKKKREYLLMDCVGSLEIIHSNKKEESMLLQVALNLLIEWHPELNLKKLNIDKPIDNEALIAYNAILEHFGKKKKELKIVDS
jgi:hypothetical protein